MKNESNSYLAVESCNCLVAEESAWGMFCASSPPLFYESILLWLNWGIWVIKLKVNYL